MKMKNLLLLLFLLLHFASTTVKAEIRTFDIYISRKYDDFSIQLGYEIFKAIEKEDYLIFKQLCGNKDAFRSEFTKVLKNYKKLGNRIGDFGTKYIKSFNNRVFFKRIYYKQLDGSIEILFTFEIEMKKKTFDVKRINFVRHTKLDKEIIEDLNKHEIGFYRPFIVEGFPGNLVVDYKNKEVFYSSNAGFFDESIQTNFPVKIEEILIGQDSVIFSFSEKRFQTVKELKLIYIGDRIKVNKDSSYSYINQLSKLSGLNA